MLRLPGSSLTTQWSMIRRPNPQSLYTLFPLLHSRAIPQARTQNLSRLYRDFPRASSLR